MFKQLSILLGLTLLFLACGGPASDEERKPTTEPPEAVSGKAEDAVLARLSGELIANPTTQAERDRNAIVDYAIEHMLDVQSTPSGLYYQIIEPGEGEKLAWGDRLKAHYKGYSLEGEAFDQSDPDEPLEFYLGNTIDGWNEGLQLISPGGKIFLLVPSGMAYGEKGVETTTGDYLIPPNAVLAFEVSVVEVVFRRGE